MISSIDIFCCASNEKLVRSNKENNLIVHFAENLPKDPTQKLKVELLIVEDTLAAEYLAVDKIQKSMKLVASNNFLLGVKLRQTNDRIFILENAQKLYKGILNSRKRKTKPAPQTIIIDKSKT